jgi:four helix bundle protein
VGGQLLRSGTSPLPNHGEAQAAESRADFLHKMRICLKELRESRRWLRLIDRSPRLRSSKLPDSAAELVRETEELIRIFFTSVRTAASKGRPGKPPAKAADAAFGRAAIRQPKSPL